MCPYGNINRMKNVKFHKFRHYIYGGEIVQSFMGNVRIYYFYFLVFNNTVPIHTLLFPLHTYKFASLAYLFSIAIGTLMFTEILE